MIEFYIKKINESKEKKDYFSVNNYTEAAKGFGFHISDQIFLAESSAKKDVKRCGGCVADTDCNCLKSGITTREESGLYISTVNQ